MLQVYIPKEIQNLRVLSFLAPVSSSDNRLFQNIDIKEFENIIKRVEKIKDAEYVLIPHYLPDLANYSTYVPDAIAEAKTAGIRCLLFTNQDSPDDLIFPDTIVFRPSAYKSKLDARSIIIPGQVQDLGQEYGYEPLHKKTQPGVGFVGKAGLSSVKELVRFFYKNFIILKGPCREGVFFRRKALNVLKKSDSVELHSKIRRRFSAHKKTIEAPIAEIRGEYIENIQENLFTLCPRGDGNYSLRFYEVLSLGRIPLVIDTDMELPLEDRVPYDTFIVRVHWSDIENLATIIAKLHESTSDEIFQKMQASAREHFVKYLHMPPFLRIVLSKEYLDLIP
ncbi:glycosyltransferase family 47 protein [Patescibacteria group bacterium]|nr:glycosyltransferase family 47 protein [Patescibacteria group bacterium]